MAFPPPPGTQPPPQRLPGDGPWWSRLLTERGLGAVLAVVLVGAMLVLGTRLVASLESYQSTAVAEAARTNEKLEQLQLSHLEQKAQMDRIERAILARSAP